MATLMQPTQGIQKAREKPRSALCRTHLTRDNSPISSQERLWDDYCQLLAAAGAYEKKHVQPFEALTA